VRRVAIATSVSDDVNLDPDADLLLDALRGVGIDASMRVWNDRSIKWNDYDLTVIRSTWDYTRDRPGYLDWARGIERLLNPYPIIEYSTDKHYLRDLAERSHRVVPSTFCDVGEDPQFPVGRFVVKPTVGAGSIDAEKYGPDDHEDATVHVRQLHASGRDAMIQPYVASIDDDGERALVFIDGSFSHAMTKGAMLNTAPDDRDALFRREQMSVANAEPDAVAFAQAVLNEELFHGNLYGRVDLVKMYDGWAIMELELVEPSLFLAYDKSAPRKLAEAILARLDWSKSVQEKHSVRSLQGNVTASGFLRSDLNDGGARVWSGDVLTRDTWDV
jgi:O-ureido-D-serine cyclo-ligase